MSTTPRASSALWETTTTPTMATSLLAAGEPMLANAIRHCRIVSSIVERSLDTSASPDVPSAPHPVRHCRIAFDATQEERNGAGAFSGSAAGGGDHRNGAARAGGSRLSRRDPDPRG